ncbi:phosphoribosylamine--glycine ligase [Erwinia amylovora]|uniref:phosphoribosylamine--glycine ligase n=3 Tax=Erwinia amylovora TaxID=552 RepID=A0A831A4L8_ERWAM|nr:phosphoribosylamine--glycine ligase [Erwinia amylovora]CDK16527.1 phosphoribosylamine-glycine ligase [Erwinia amylovora LA635]CDK19894.1 phosphoribosylamine-glycine ligase [Erwinia amylovora LA636]CDK23265.1 phosphoribosylamine-glycine ligase [Erwinia amylovora LA637]ATZ10364.1 phosphoribosylamine--glycine ligase [Erwinia amylovora]EKV52634.1 phosphoribosylamine-glycine ligase [Erwinia amylovora ACW56400]
MTTRKRKILIYGSGNSREHATYDAIRQDMDCECYCAIKNSNALLELMPNVHRIRNANEAIVLARELAIDRVLILSPSELIAGDCDKFRLAGFNTFGASKRSSLLESSKSFAKNFMQRYNIPTPECRLFTDYSMAEQILKSEWSERNLVIKPDIFSMNAYDRTATPDSLEEAIRHLRRFYTINPDSPVILENRISGYELSLHVLFSGDDYFILPLVQDYKRLCDQDKGPMTHGMAALAFNGNYPKKLMHNIKSRIIEPTLLGLNKEGIEFNSILYFGLMISDDTPYLLEYNVRSGNPEWISILGLLDSNLIDALEFSAPENWKRGYSLTSFVTTKDYPVINEDHFSVPIANVYPENCCDVFGESITKSADQFYPSGGRIVAFRDTGSEFELIKRNVLNAAGNIELEGKQYRTDMSPFF